jgi:hypothetical protein
MSFPPGTEMFQFPGFASATYGFSDGYPLKAGGLPHSEILGSTPARGSPGLVAACHVLHRLLAPRHPPDALAFLGPPQRQPHLHPTKLRFAGTPLRGHTCPRSEASSCGRSGTDDSSNNSLHKRPCRRSCAGGALAYPCHFDARTLRRKQRGDTRIACQRPSTHDAREALREAFAPADGLHHHHTMSKEQSPTTRPP